MKRLEEVVVCGSDGLQNDKLFSNKDSSSANPQKRALETNKFNNKMAQKTPRAGKKVDRAGLVKSVNVDPKNKGNENGGHSHDGHGHHAPHPLVKTLSEQNVTSMERSSKMRNRQSSPKPRPVSAYQHMSVSVDRKSLGVSKIPVPTSRTSPHVSSMTRSQNSANSTPPNLTPPSTACQQRSKKVEVKPPVEQVTPKLESKFAREVNEFVRPRLVTIIRHGMKPRKAVRFLLNKKTARSYDQVLNELTESVKPDWGAVRKVFTLSGVEVTCLEDFFGDADIFLVCPNDRIGTNDFDLDSEECKSIQPFVKASLHSKLTRFKLLEASRSPQHRARPKSSNSQSTTPPHPKYLPLSHFPSALLGKYVIGNIIGDGNFAVVRECSDRVTKERFALKIIDKAKCQGRDAPPEHEVAILGMIQHKNIVEMFEQYDYSNELYIVMELVESGDLFDVIAAVTKFSEKDSKLMTRDIASALEFLHDLKIVHRDIKPENLLVYTENNGQRRIKLGDFGLAKIVDGPMYTVCGTPTYVAPEILSETGYGVKVDIWALGVILYILLCGYPPFVSPTGDQEGLFDLILSAEYDFPEEHWDEISDGAKQLISHMLQAKPFMRFCAAEVMNHPWIRTEDPIMQYLLEKQKQRPHLNLEYKIFEAMGLTSTGSIPDGHN